MGIDIETTTFDDFVRSMKGRRSYGLLTLDAVLLAVMERLEIQQIASADKVFSKIKEIKHYQVEDIQISF